MIKISAKRGDGKRKSKQAFHYTKRYLSSKEEGKLKLKEKKKKNDFLQKKPIQCLLRYPETTSNEHRIRRVIFYRIMKFSAFSTAVCFRY